MIAPIGLFPVLNFQTFAVGARGYLPAARPGFEYRLHRHVKGGAEVTPVVKQGGRFVALRPFVLVGVDAKHLGRGYAVELSMPLKVKSESAGIFTLEPVSKV